MSTTLLDEFEGQMAVDEGPGIVEQLRSIRENLDEHEEILRDWDGETWAPELIGPISRLGHLRQRVSEDLNALLFQVEVANDPEVHDLWPRFQDLLGRLEEYECAEANVYFRAYWLDLGMGD